MNEMRALDTWRFLDDLFDTSSRMFQSVRARAAGRFPPANVYYDETAIRVDLELPGKTAKDVDLTLDAQALVIADHPAPIEAAAGEAPVEAPTPAWRRRLELPFRVDASKIAAKFEKGILSITLPKAESTLPKRIAIAG